MIRCLKMDSKGIDYLQRRYEALGLSFTPNEDTVITEGEMGLGIGTALPFLEGESAIIELGMLENKRRSGSALLITPSNMMVYIGTLSHPVWVGPGQAVSLSVKLQLNARVDADLSHLINVHVVDILT